MLTRRERRWHWHTWNILLQIREATDGNDPRQRAGEMTTRGLCISASRSEMIAFRNRGWVTCIGFGELALDDNGNTKEHPIWEITDTGRAAIAAAEKEGITIQ